MKKIIIIVVAVLAAIIVVGVVAKKIEDKQKIENPNVTTLVYKDDEGNDATMVIPNETVSVKIDGQTYKYNPYVWINQPIIIGGETFKQPHYIKNFEDRGFETETNGIYVKGETQNIYITYNTHYGYVKSIRVYHKLYNQNASLFYDTCEDVVLPCNIKLGVTTKSEVEKYFGVSSQTEHKGSNLVVETYYGASSKRGEYIKLTYELGNEVLCGIEWMFDTKGLSYQK